MEETKEQIILMILKQKIVYFIVFKRSLRFEDFYINIWCIGSIEKTNENIQLRVKRQ